jgi:hypothetical protein
MTITWSPLAHRRIRPVTEHAYTLPVVREIPPQLPHPVGAQSLW